MTLALPQLFPSSLGHLPELEGISMDGEDLRRPKNAFSFGRLMNQAEYAISTSCSSHLLDYGLSSNLDPHVLS